jgi:hypothetical protein
MSGMNTTATIEQINELQALREELALQQSIARANELRTMIVVNERAIPHLRAIPLRHAHKRIADAKDELGTLEMLIRFST